MKAILLFLLLPFVFCIEDDGRLLRSENLQLQRTCGRGEFFGLHNLKGYGSQPVRRRRAPWAIAISKAKDKGQGITARLEHSRQFCSGSLISSRHVLTAAHCVFEERFNDLLIVVDNDCADAESNCKLDPFFVRRIRKVFYPSEFPHNSSISMHNNDMAVLELARDIPFSNVIYPTCLASTRAHVGEPLTAYGYGADIRPDGCPLKKDGLLQEISTTVVDCEFKSDDIRRENDHFCTKDRQHICSGDSGSGFIRENPDGTKVVLGVASNGNSCEEIPHGVEFDDSDTLVAPHLLWICHFTGICPSPYRGFSYEGEVRLKKNRFMS